MICQTHLETKAAFKLPLNADNSAIDEYRGGSTDP
jgi:hypothetical protein